MPISRHRALQGALLIGGALVLSSACEPGPSDSTISREVTENLERDQDLAPYDVEVTTEDGRVTLSGRVPQEMQRSEAERIARATPGVEDVVNRIQASHPPMTPPAVGAPPPSTGPERDPLDG
jgi:hypothetical protein